MKRFWSVVLRQSLLTATFIAVSLPLGARGEQAPKPLDVESVKEAVAVTSARVRAFDVGVGILMRRLEAIRTQMMVTESMAEQYADDGGGFGGFGFGPRAQAEAAGNYAARQAIGADLADLQKQQDSVIQLIHDRVDDETWARLSRAEQQVAAEHDLIPKFDKTDVRLPDDDESTKADREKLASQLPSATPPAASPPGWSEMRDDELSCRFLFPETASTATEEGLVKYTVDVGGTRFEIVRTVESFAGGELDRDATAEMLKSYTEGLVESLNELGGICASRKAQLAGLPARDILCFRQDEIRGPQLSIMRVSVVKGKMVVAQVGDAKAEDVEESRRIDEFFASVTMAK